MAGTLEQFGGWANQLDIGNVPEDVRRRLALQVANAMGAARAGTSVDWLPTDRSGEGASLVVGGTADPYTAAFVNAAASMVHDYDDYLFMGHTGHSAVFGALAACEREGLDGAALLENVLIANELEGRLGAAVALGPHNGQMWAFIHQAGAAAVAANAQGDASDIAEAVRLALYNPDYPLEAGFIDGESKTFTAAKPTAAGLRIGDAACEGARGSPDALENFLSSYGFLPFPEMVDGFGQSWVTRSLCLKPRPGCAYVQSPLECLERLTEQGLDADAVEEVRVRAPLLSVAMEGLSEPYRRPGRRLLPINVTFSIYYTLALHLVAGEVTPQTLSESYLSDHRAELDAMADRITLEHDWGLTASVLEGLSAGIDYGPLLKDRGLAATLRGFKQLGDAHSSLDTPREVAGLLSSGEVLSVLQSLRSPLGWETFDMGNAQFNDLQFNFGAVVDVRADGERYRASASEHAGACGRNLDAVEETVRRKFEREVGDGFATVADADSQELEELTALLSSSKGG